MTPVIFDGNDQDVGNIIKVKICKSNQNTLFGESLKNQKKEWHKLSNTKKRYSIFFKVCLFRK